MAARSDRPVRRLVALLLVGAASGGCFAGHSAASVPTTSSSTVAVDRGSAAVSPATRASSTTTTPAITTTSTTTAPAGPPYPVAALTVPLVDPSRPTISHGRTVSSSRALTTTVWFPDRPGRFPLVVFAHGFDVSPAPYTSLLETWAAHGYVVAAPAFPLTDPAVAGADLDEGDINNQPADVRFVTDQLVAPPDPLSARIDRTRVSVAGHSDGAETALAASTATVPPGEPAYRAVVVMSGQPVPGAAGHNPPALIVQGDADTINPPDYGYSTWDQAASPKLLLVLRGAGHLPPFEAGSPWLSGVEAVTDAFFDVYVAQDGAPTSLAASAARYHNLSLRTG